MEQLDYLQGAVRKTHSNILRLVAYSQLSRQVINLFSSKFNLYIPTPPHACIHHPGGYGIGGLCGRNFCPHLTGQIKTMLIDM